MDDEEYMDNLKDFVESIDINYVKMTFCELFDEKSNVWNFQNHSHDFIELIYFLDGKATVNVPDSSIDLSFFELIVYPPGVMHQEFLDMHYHQEIICINLECKHNVEFHNSFKIKDINGELKWIVEKIYFESKSKEFYKDQVLSEYLKLFLILIKRNVQSSNTINTDAFEKCVQYIHDHFSEKLSIEQLSKVSFVSPSYMSRIFKKRIGTTPMNYLNIYRIEIAKKMLLLKKESVQEIALLVGIEDSKHFIKVFKKITGVTPLRYRINNTNSSL